MPNTLLTKITDSAPFFRAETALLRRYAQLLKAATGILPFKWPQTFEGPGSSLELVRHIASVGHRRVLIVTDAVLQRLGLLDEMKAELSAHGITHVTYDGVEPDPTVAQIEEGYALLSRHGCDGILAVGGGSPIDAAKLIGARAKNRKPVAKMAGLFLVWRGTLPIYAVPTTAGTGSEVSIGAVASDPDNQQKLPAVDLRLLPAAAAVDGALMTGVPPHVTAATGMDALTHAVEAYLSRIATPTTDENAIEAAQLVLENLEAAYADGSNVDTRQNLARAAHLAGIAFSLAGLGYIHGIAHNLGVRYHVPHGVANAIAMPHVLEYSLPECTERLASLARACGVGPAAADDRERARAFIARIRELKETFEIPETLADLEPAEVPAIARAARAEARFMYAVPRFMDQAAAEAVVRRMLPAEAREGASAREPRAPQAVQS